MSSTREARDRAASEQARQLSHYVEVVHEEHTNFARTMLSAGEAVDVPAAYREHVIGLHERTLAMLLTVQERLLAARAGVGTEMTRLVADTEAHAATVTAASIARHSTATGTVNAALLEGFRGEAEELEQSIGELLAEHERQTATYEQCVRTVLDEWVAFEEQSQTELNRRATELAAQRLHRAHLGAARLLREANAVAPTPATSTPATSMLPPPQMMAPQLPVEVAPAATTDDATPVAIELPAASAPPTRWWRRVGGSALPVLGVVMVVAVVMVLIG
jgi:hypothetical protein